MSDELLDLVDNIRRPEVWLRVLFMLGFAIASYIILLPLILIISLVQALFVIFSGESNANLRYFSATLELYISQIIKFLTYLSETRPFPFSDMPEVEDNSLEQGEELATKEGAKSASVQKAGSEGKPANKSAKKPTAKPTKKKAAKKSAKEKVKSKARASQDSESKD